MSKIKILPEILSNKIAAGEVVERPASVVKELVENSLDAGSKRIMVDIVQGGRSLIRVSDNGSGMNRDDALLALERYATSKIYKDRDLFSIHTLGFRGEALPSIASVSQFSLVTRAESDDAGTEILVEGGKIKNVAEVGAPPGTMVTVKQLFFNTPARRKFLKTVGTEMAHIAERVARIALGQPGVQFRLTHNDKIVKDWPVTSSTFDRVVDVLGSELKNDLYAIESRIDRIAVSGWISSPRTPRRTFRGLYIYVNGRFVRDRIVQHALFEGYSQRLVKGQYPVAVLFIRVPFDEVDVNVHPTKNEVRFARQKEVHEAVRRTVAQTLYDVDRPSWKPAQFSADERHPLPDRISEKPQQDFGFRISDFGFNKADRESRSYSSNSDIQYEIFDESASRTPHPASRTAQASIWQQKRFGDMRVIGQLHKSYIICEAEAGLILIDQHAAHERVLFETFSTRSAGTKPSVQRLLVPETIELGFREVGVLEKLIPDLNELGLEIEPFGGNTFVVKSVPGLLAGRQVKPLILEIVEKIAEIGSGPGLAEVLDQCRMVMACHGAIRANQALGEKQIRGLLNQLDECRNPSHCPHGRPTWLRWELRELEKSFKRIV
ncbi:MAG: DNA mismatch repair endonuclease MutL [Desulfobacterales bacterium]|nr:MAG: DNA mismatch repair endonuclease MutL [Desulfobacterales bacterium]